MLEAAEDVPQCSGEDAGGQRQLAALLHLTDTSAEPPRNAVAPGSWSRKAGGRDGTEVAVGSKENHVQAYIEQVPSPTRHRDAKTLVAMMERVTGEPAQL